jgi:undecaprenyl diphosphate synthase
MDRDKLHVAIIMDGNGRWAQERRWPRTRGHRAGADAVRRTVETAPSLGIGTLTLYAFSSDNWKRPREEVGALLGLFRRFLDAETATCRQNGVRLSVIGRRDRLPAGLVAAIRKAELATAGGDALHLRLAVDYSARDAIVRAAATCSGAALSREQFRELLAEAINENEATPDVDLLIRTGREQRLSDFLLWECAYAELLFTERMWPDFTGDDLRDAVAAFRGRERRFGSVATAGQRSHDVTIGTAR